MLQSFPNQGLLPESWGGQSCPIPLTDNPAREPPFRLFPVANSEDPAESRLQPRLSAHAAQQDAHLLQAAHKEI
jgi:hypothetical protein